MSRKYAIFPPSEIITQSEHLWLHRILSYSSQVLRGSPVLNTNLNFSSTYGTLTGHMWVPRRCTYGYK
jgi:hypothetical protein